MPRTTSKSKNIGLEPSAERAIRVEKGNAWQEFKRFVTARETRMVVGILLLTFSVIALLAYVSFLFTGTYDQDLLTLDHADRVANREAIKNLLGLPGALLAQFLINGSFGFVSLLLILLLLLYSLRLMHVFRDIKAIKWFCCCTFWVLWGATVLGFAQQMTHLGVFRWGGAFGAWAAQWLTSYVAITGTILILLALLTIFLIVTDPRFIDRCKAFGAWCAGLFKKKEVTGDGLQVTGDSGEEVVIDIPIDEGSDPSDLSDSSDSSEVTFTIEPVNTEVSEIPETPEEPETTDENGEPLGDAPLPPDDLPF